MHLLLLFTPKGVTKKKKEGKKGSKPFGCYARVLSILFFDLFTFWVRKRTLFSLPLSFLLRSTPLSFWGRSVLPEGSSASYFCEPPLVALQGRA